MRLRKPRRAAWATGLSLALHVLFLAGMVAGLRVVPPPPEDRAMEVRLVTTFTPPPPRPQSPRQPPPTPQRPGALAPLRPHLTPAPSASVPTTAAPEAAPAPAPPKVVYGPSFGSNGVAPSLSGRINCEDLTDYRLTPEQRQYCDNRLAQRAQAAKPLELNITDKNKADFDRKVRCHDGATRGAIPSSDSHDLSTGAQIAGLGYNPSLKDCRPQDR